MLARKDRNFEARRAGSTVVRWESPESAAKQFKPKLGADTRSGGSLPWRMENDEWVADAATSLVTYAALSRDGQWLAWMEQRPNEAKIVARAWKVGGDAPTELPAQSGQTVGVAIANDGTLAYGQAVAGQPVDILLGRVRIDNTPDTRDRTVCLAFSPQRNWLIAAGTAAGGKLRAYTIKQAPPGGPLSATPSGPWENPFEAPNSHQSGQITACDISDDGSVVVGSDDGQVRLRRPGAKWIDLTENPTYRLAAPVEDVAIDRMGQHVSALSAWQPFDCSRPGLPGQALRVWNVAPSNDSGSIPISSVCFPNQVVLGVGDLRANKQGEPGVMLVTGRGSRWHRCPGCARAIETPEAMRDRLLERAKIAGAQR
jgi:WD40 repeat protein